MKREGKAGAGCGSPHARRANGAFRLTRECGGQHRRTVGLLTRRGEYVEAWADPPDPEDGRDAKGYRPRRRAASAVPGGRPVPLRQSA